MWVNMKIQFLFYALLTLRLGFCSDDLKIEVKSVTAGQNVTLRCLCQISPLYRDTFYWIRIVSGNRPEFLGATACSNIDNVSKIPHIQTKKEEGEFHLRINKATRNDTGLYYCIKVRQLDFRFMNGTFLKIKGQESDIIDVILDPPSGSVNKENSETLQCSVLSNSEGKPCPADNRVYWFKAGSDQSHPSLLYLQGKSGDECERIPEASSARKCFYNFSETSHSGIYHCAVAACGQILFGNGLNLQDDGANSVDLPKILLPSLCSALVISLLAISLLIYKIKKKKCDCCNGPATRAGDSQSQKSEENHLVYSAPTFNKNKAKNGERRNVRTLQEETVYTDVRTFR